MSLIFPSHETMRLAAEAEKHIQSVASSSRDVTQPAGEAYSSRRTPLAAPFPNPHVETSPCAATGVDGSEPSASSIDLESLAAWRESQGQPIDAEPRIR